MRNVKENIGMGDKKSNAKGVSPHLIQRSPVLCVTARFCGKCAVVCL